MDDIFFSDFRLFVLFNKKLDMSLSPEVEITQIFKNSLLNFSSITTRFMYKYMSLTPPFAIVLPLRTLVSCHVDRLQFGYYGFVFNAEGHAPFFLHQIRHRAT